MSVTFAPKIESEVVYKMTCGCGEKYESESAFAVRDLYETHLDRASCGRFAKTFDAVYSVPEAAARINLAPTNAALMLDLLGLPSDALSGEHDPDDMIGRAILARVLIRAESWSIPEAVSYFATREAAVAYFEKSLSAIQSAAEAAKTLGVPVAWS